MFAFKWALVLLAAGIPAQSDLEEIIAVFSKTPAGVARLQAMIDTVQDQRKLGRSGRAQVPLRPPRTDYGITGERLQELLLHNYIATCTQHFVEIGACYCKGKFEETTIFTNKTMEARAAVAVDLKNSLVVVAYRMTVGFKNWETNDDQVLVSHPFPDGEPKVHRGHLQYYLSLKHGTEKRVVKLLKDPRYKNFTLHVTGYSLGGSVTAISMPGWLSLLQREGLKNNAQFYDYSGPRPGNLAYARHLETLGAPLIRYARHGDVVPQFPDQNMGYSQVGQEYYDTTESPLANINVQKCSFGLIEDRNCSLSNTEFNVPTHFTAFSRPVPLPPFCEHH